MWRHFLHFWCDPSLKERNKNETIKFFINSIIKKQFFFFFSNTNSTFLYISGHEGKCLLQCWLFSISFDFLDKERAASGVQILPACECFFFRFEDDDDWWYYYRKNVFFFLISIFNPFFYCFVALRRRIYNYFLTSIWLLISFLILRWNTLFFFEIICALSSFFFYS